MLAVADLLDQRLQAQPFKTKLESTALLSGVQLLRYLSLTGLIESVVDVSAELHKSTANQDSAEHSPTILLIQSLSSTLADTNRRSGSTQTTALVTNLLRSLTHLSQTHRHLLLLVELDFEPRNHGTSTDANRRTNPAEQAQALATRQSNVPALSSAFSSQQGHTITLLPSTASIGCALDSGMDVIVAVHDAFGKARAHDKEQAKKGINGAKTAVVEVLKDRAGHHTGNWCLWVQ
jgi:phosphopantetheine adenylyltransferase